MQQDPFADFPDAPPAGQPVAAQRNAAPGVIRGPAAMPKQPDPPKATETFRTMTPQEVTAQGLPEGGVYQVNDAGRVQVIQEPPKQTAPQQKQEQRIPKLRSLLEQIERVEQLHRENIRGGFPNPIAGRVPFVPETEQFTSASAGMAEQGLSAFRVPGVGAQSDAELRQFVEANRPLATDTDLAIEEKLRQLRARARAELAELTGEDIAAAPTAQPPAFDGGAGRGGEPPVQEQDRRFGAGMDFGDSNEGVAVETGETRREDDPALAGVRQEYARRLGAGQSAQEIIKWARSAGINPSAFRGIIEQVKFRDENPEVPIEQYDTAQLDDRFVPVSGFDQAMSAAADSGLGTYAIAAGNAASGFLLDEAVGATGGNTERARLGMNALAEKRPIANALGTVSGGVMTSLGGEAALGAAGVRAGLPRALAADTAYGATAGAGGATEGNRLAGAGAGAFAGAAGSYAGQRVGQALGAAARGVRDTSVNTLRREGVTDMTIGQTVGNSGRVGAAVKGVEDRLSGVPVIGDMVNARRTEGLRQFNQAAFRRALEPIGGDVGDKVGQDAIEEAQNQVSKAYTDALSGVGIVPDREFNTAFSSALLGVQSLKRVGPEIFDDVVDLFRAYDSDPMLSGEAIDQISRDLRTLKFAYKTDARFPAIAKQIDRVERAVFDLADRQASGKIPEYMAARRAYRRLSTLEDAVLKAQNQPDNVFTAAQLGQADRANTKRFGGKRAAARGDTPFNELQQAGQEVLPNRVPDSGTAGRLLVPLVAVGAGGAADASGQTNGFGLTIGGILAALYSRTGQRLLTKSATGMKQGTRGRALLESPRTRRAIGASGAALGASAATDRSGPR